MGKNIMMLLRSELRKKESKLFWLRRDVNNFEGEIEELKTEIELYEVAAARLSLKKGR